MRHCVVMVKKMLIMNCMFKILHYRSLYSFVIHICCTEFCMLLMLHVYFHRPAIVVLLMSMVNEKQPFSLRCAVLYCFQSFLYKNEVGQSQIVQTLLPTSADGKAAAFISKKCITILENYWYP